MAEVDDSDAVTASMSNGGGGGEATPTDKTAQAPAANPLSRKLQRVLGGTGGGTVGPLDPEVSERVSRGGVSAVVCVVHASTRLQAPIFFSSPSAALIFFMLMYSQRVLRRYALWCLVVYSELFTHRTHTHLQLERIRECKREWCFGELCTEQTLAVTCSATQRVARYSNESHGMLYHCAWPHHRLHRLHPVPGAGGFAPVQCFEIFLIPTVVKCQTVRQQQLAVRASVQAS